MSDYPHTTSGYADGGVRCSCGATWTRAFHVSMPTGKTWGRDCPLALRVALMEAERERDAAILRHDEDLGRMQRVVYDALCAAVKDALPDEPLSRIDGAGSDGDEFDFTEAEVSIACGMLTDALAEARRERDELLAICDQSNLDRHRTFLRLAKRLMTVRAERDEARRERDARPDPGALLARLDTIRAAAATGARPAELARMIEDVQAGMIRPPTGDGDLLGGERSCFTCKHDYTMANGVHGCSRFVPGRESSDDALSAKVIAYTELSGATDDPDLMPTNRSIRCPGWAAKEPK